MFLSSWLGGDPFFYSLSTIFALNYTSANMFCPCLPQPAPTAAVVHESILSTIGNTPLVKLSRRTVKTPGVNVYVKCEAFNPMSSVKDRMALNCIEQAEKTGDDALNLKNTSYPCHSGQIYQKPVAQMVISIATPHMCAPLLKQCVLCFHKGTQFHWQVSSSPGKQ